jgi:hypothetical protein
MTTNWITARWLAGEDVNALQRAETHYGTSWKKRGGVGAFMMLARKWDRIENEVSSVGFDVFKAYKAFPGKEGIADDINDLIRYLMLVRLEMEGEGIEEGEPSSSYTNQDGNLLDK